MLEVHQFICRKDNFGLLVHDHVSGQTACIDTPDEKAILAELEVRAWQLTYILNTHHHHDHTGGNLALKEKTGCTIFGAKSDAHRIPGLDKALAEGDVFAFGKNTIRVIETPGHTTGHIIYWFEEAGLVFVGDTLFSLGCGRLFEGTPEQMLTSMVKLAALPEETKIYCGHEYTYSNSRFALSVEKENHKLRKRVLEIEACLAQNQPTLPVTIATEKATNPFLRTFSKEIRRNLKLENADDVAVFAKLRALKDTF